jgi:hypothetical protein
MAFIDNSRIWVPDGAQEALLDLTRAREDMKHLQLQAKQRLLAFFLRHGKRFSGKSHWTRAHYRWMIEAVKFEQPAQQIVSQEYIDTVILLDKRVKAFDEHIERAASASVFWPVNTRFNSLPQPKRIGRQCSGGSWQSVGVGVALSALALSCACATTFERNLALGADLATEPHEIGSNGGVVLAPAPPAVA